jgi:hypothetical protein
LFGGLHDNKWKIKHGEHQSDPFRTQEEAIKEAVNPASESGTLSQVLVQAEDLTFRTEWTYGKDPFPPPG